MTHADSNVIDLLNALYASFSSGDASAWADRLADDVLIVGTDEVEWFSGKVTTMPTLQAQLDQMSASGIRLTAGEPVARVRDGWFWIADRPVLHRPDGSSATLRVSMVGSGSGGALVIEHMHLSAGAPNEEVVQQELTV